MTSPPAPHLLANSREKKLAFGILFSFYLTLSLVRFIWPAQLATSFVLSATGLLALGLLSVNLPKKYLGAYLLVGFLILSFVASCLVVGRSERIGHVVLFVLANAGIAFVLVKGYVSPLSTYLVFYGLSAYFSFLIFTGISARDALTASSYNGISMMMLAACVSLYAVLGVSQRKIDLKPALITLLICTWAIGRSGILASLFLMVGLSFLSLHARRPPAYIYLLFVAGVSLVAYFLFVNLDTLAQDSLVLGDAVGNYSARSAEVDSPRLAMWSNYFNNLDFSRIVFGANILTDPWPEGPDFAYNYHNSWISLHSQTGWMGLVFFGLVGLSLLRYLKNNRLFFVLFSTIIIRWSTDTGIFFESWDFLFYFFIFYYLCGKANAPELPVPLKAGAVGRSTGQ